MNTYDKNYDWGLNSEMENLLNGINLDTDKHVLYTDGDKQYIYDQTTPNMIQRLNGIFERKPLISRDI